MIIIRAEIRRQSRNLLYKGRVKGSQSFTAHDISAPGFELLYNKALKSPNSIIILDTAKHHIMNPPIYSSLRSYTHINRLLFG